MSINLNGIIAALPTPFDQAGEVAHDKLKDNIEQWNRSDVLGYLILGSTGEFPHLTRDEKLAVIETVRGMMPYDKKLLVGTSELSTRHTIEMTKLAADAGADAAVVVTPFYYKKILDEEQHAAHYRRIADVAPMPVLIYLIPQFSGVYLLPETIVSLAAHPNIIGLKDSSGDLPALRDLFRDLEARQIQQSDFGVLVGAPTIYKQSIEDGAAGGVLAVSCIAPNTCCALDRMVRQGDDAAATALQERLAKFSRRTTVNGIGYVKAALDLVGLYGYLPRSPLPAPDEAARAEIADAIAESEFFERHEGEEVWREKTTVNEPAYAD